MGVGMYLWDACLERVIITQKMRISWNNVLFTHSTSISESGICHVIDLYVKSDERKSKRTRPVGTPTITIHV